ncbi:MAG TPA: DNA-deoxyinosine glycosylase [Myxococcota bacterium]|nr:DNA-deoxyinosine glycosylase [Myxococcota bacterium]
MRTRIYSFEPVADPASRVLILGSMPGRASLRAREYYAHPQNAFWKILGSVLGFEPSAAYEARLSRLRAHGIALWDVLRSCVRESSLDSDIDEGSIVVNPFADFFARHPQIGAVCFNGAKAEAAWRRHVLPRVEQAGALRCWRLPSTSPANASIGYAEKLDAWHRALRATARATARGRRYNSPIAERRPARLAGERRRSTEFDG